MLRNYKLNTYEFLKYKEKKHVKEKQKKTVSQWILKNYG